MIYQKLFALLVTITTIMVVGCGNGQARPTATSNSQTAAKNEVVPIVDVSKFFRISDSELVKLLGEPETKDTWNFSSPNGNKYKATTYEFEEGNKEFMVIDNKVVRFTYLANELEYTSDDDLFKQLGVSPSTDMKKSVAGVSTKFNSVTDKVPEIWVTIIDNKIEEIKVTYDLRYF